ncbi:MAG: ATP-binding cassette domain-containing protein [Cyanobacteria bacterium]|jgi:lipopolysaccharide transport system ATP-binding protein|nr:ATP-binding cassette domain-containing protein [Cyanobacteria bacterium GSL.Bin1]
MSDTMIRVENLGKKYVIGHKPEGWSRYVALRDVMANAGKSLLKKIRHPQSFQQRNQEEFWALQDVSFEVKRGDRVGIIGRNGAGKSTLLKILSRITEPTTGRIELNGRVASLLEVGTGFHPELTGRENIYLNGAILGMGKAEIKKKFDEIVAFAEVEKFLDTPVKRYSSGMYVRLAFAVAAHLEPEILVVDEVLAVGDAAFQKKCLGKMEDVATNEGRTVLFVSHNMAAVENLCQKGILLNSGQIITKGNSQDVINYYLQSILPTLIANNNLKVQKNRRGNGKVKFTQFYVEDTYGNTVSSVKSGMDIILVFGFECSNNESPKNIDIGFSLHNKNDITLFVLYSSYVGQIFKTIPPEGEFRCFVPRLPLSAGSYRIGGRIISNYEESDWPKDGLGYLNVEVGDFYGTGSQGFSGNTDFLIDGQWKVMTSSSMINAEK